MYFINKIVENTPSYLNTGIASGHPSILDLHIGWGMGEFTLGIRPRAFLTLELAADLQLKPSRVLLVEEVVDVEHCQSIGRQVGGVGHGRGIAHQGGICLSKAK